MCYTRLAGNTGRKNRQKFAIWAPSHNFVGLYLCIFATKACIDNRKQVVKHQYLLHMSPQCGGLRPITGRGLLARLGHPSKFQRLSRVVSVTAATLLNGSHTIFAQCLVVSWTGTLYIRFQRLLPHGGILKLQNSLCVQVLRSSVLAASLQGTPAAGVCQTLPRWEEDATYIRQNGYHVGYRLTF